MRSLAAILALFVVLVAMPALAQDDEATRAAAREAFRAGEAAFIEEDDARALTLFRRAFELAPHDAVRFNIAVCLERLGRPEEALQEYEAAAISTQLDEAARARARSQADALRARIVAARVPPPVPPLPPPREPEPTLAPGWLTWTGGALAVLGAAGIIGFSIRTSDLEAAYVAQPTVATRDEGLLMAGLAYTSIGVTALGALLVVLDLAWLRTGAEARVAITGTGVAVRF
ncbi:tetratricopeptide repeat protein [Sandaracinus amylolyticus]|uniref:Tetratricopeptide repeat protein n=1 Tax=Sandaracinus amylolyticus TaxID=927083 RepID=A0A0F6YGM2_9BACT|nr:tetratricopeptide repeat protein [Sandaracinus amylolyticus]AKF04107.1 hypothetical protein DB32_001256 [Sandaracinus amylolyticus]